MLFDFGGVYIRGGIYIASAETGMEKIVNKNPGSKIDSSHKE